MIERQAVSGVAVTRDFRQTAVERSKRAPAFAGALLDEATTLLLNGEPHTARLVPRALVGGSALGPA